MQDNSSCHHCHIHAPIPAKDLKRTHPLRSHTLKKPENDVRPSPPPSPHPPRRVLELPLSSESFRKNISFLYRKISKKDDKEASGNADTNGSVPIPPPPPPPAGPPMPPSKSQDRRPAILIDSEIPSSSTESLEPVLRERRRRSRGGCVGLQAALLVGAYALLVRQEKDLHHVHTGACVLFPSTGLFSHLSFWMHLEIITVLAEILCLSCKFVNTCFSLVNIIIC